MSPRDLLEDAERQRDGRNIDDRLGTLSGEGSQQRIKHLEEPHPQMPVPFPPHVAAANPAPSYYGMPAVKEPVWIWSIPAYFYVGGVAGAASVLGAVADAVGGKRLEGLARRCHLVGTVGDALSGALLIHDLGRPSRFLNMLRVFRPTSPMSIGSWVLAASGGANATALLFSRRKSALGAFGKFASFSGAAFGSALAGYTGVLLANSANPFWQRAHRGLPLLFMGSAVASAGALLSLLPGDGAAAKVTIPFARAGAMASLAAARRVERQVEKAEPTDRPLKQGLSGALWNAFKACTTAGLALSLLPGKQERKDDLSNALITVGALALRFAVFHAGKAAARNPHATFEPQREGFGAAEVGTASEVLRREKPERFRLPVLR